MKSKGRPTGSITKSLLKDLVNRPNANSKVPNQKPAVDSQVLQPAELDQDAGGRYNSNHTDPQT